MTTVFTCAHLQVDPHNLCDLEFVFRGHFVLQSVFHEETETYSEEAWIEVERSEKCRLDVDPNALPEALGHVPIYVGGRAILSDPVELIGSLGISRGKLIIGTIKSGKLFRQNLEGMEPDVYPF